MLVWCQNMATGADINHAPATRNYLYKRPLLAALFQNNRRLTRKKPIICVFNNTLIIKHFYFFTLHFTF